MSFSKLNVLHWHISDAQSFPMYLKSFPDFVKYTAYSSEEIYTVDDIEDIRSHARLRGVRIMPEIDSPSHVNAISFDPDFADIVICN